MKFVDEKYLSSTGISITSSNANSAASGGGGFGGKSFDTFCGPQIGADVTFSVCGKLILRR